MSINPFNQALGSVNQSQPISQVNNMQALAASQRTSEASTNPFKQQAGKYVGLGPDVKHTIGIG